jgi:hypothetical protein
MKKNIVAPIGGVVILIGGLILALYTATNANAIQESRARSVERYISQAKKAVSDGDIKRAKKLIKSAIVLDPKSKDALKEFESITLLGCQKIKSKQESGRGTVKDVTTSKSTTSTPISTNTETEQPEAEEEDEMGCI